MNSTLSNNSSGYSGGGIGIRNSDAPGVLNSMLTGNSSDRGGGIHVFVADNLSIVDSTLTGNSAKDLGGGIYAGLSDFVSVVNSTLAGNLTGDPGLGQGGGIVAINADNFSITNSTVSSNSASGKGGGIFTNASSSLSVVNSIISGNRALQGAEISQLSGSNQPLAGNLFGDKDSTFNQAFENFVPGTADLLATSDNGGHASLTPLNIQLDQILRSPDDNGCVTQAVDGCVLTQALVPNSPALDAADNTYCGPGKLIEVDQRGEPREENACDIGAFEGFVDDSISDSSCYVINGAGSNTIVFCL